MALSRRQVLVGTALGGGLVVAWALVPRRFPLPLAAGPGETAFNAWLKIGRDGVVTMAVPQLEMGQGVTTVLPQVVATELGADWRQVAVEPAPVSGAYANVALAARWAELWMPAFPGLAAAPEGIPARRWAEAHRFMATADGTSLTAYERPAREAAAAARALLCKAAASRWGVGWKDCDAQGGFVIHGRQRLPFGDLAEDAAGYRPPRHPRLRPALAQERPVPQPPGTPVAFPRLDLPSKVDGSHLFAADVRLPGMVHAAIRHSPVGESRLERYDQHRARGIPGFLELVSHQHWLAATGTDWWAAERALGAIAPEFSVRHGADSSRIEAALNEGLHRGKASRIAAAGDPDTWLSGDFTLARRYDVAPALHATVETASATARLRDGKLELWVASQAPEAARQAAAAALGIAAHDVILYPMPAGGSFDRRLEHDHGVEAALIARAVGRPVQLTWSRWQEHVAARPRPPVAAVIAVRAAPSGEPIAWKARLATPASAREFGRRVLDGHSAQDALAASTSGDPLALEGAAPPYSIEHLVVEHVPVATGLPSGRLRGNAHGYTAFFTESFLDELAHLGRHEPLAYRMALLGEDPRLAQCLQRVSSLADWAGLEANGQGLACHRIGPVADGACMAAVASARRDARGVRVDKIAAVADIGRIVNMDVARQQIEGGLVFGLGLALGSSTSWAAGLPQTGRLGLLGLPLLGDCPEIAVELIDSNAPAADPGEIGVAVVAPAVANALFSATGVRFRRLPLTEEEE
ncbi:MAG: xanthine dehydrogenase family protein molybdopterin-binding subunit [Novosphingobium sp.]|nr:xanthine dehydrogenase family protein molybdopterin-binding subunit [Novosphingobium sp.]